MLICTFEVYIKNTECTHHDIHIYMRQIKTDTIPEIFFFRTIFFRPLIANPLYL